MATVSLNPSRGQILSWASMADGTRLVGRFDGMREGKYGPLADLTPPTGR